MRWFSTVVCHLLLAGCCALLAATTAPLDAVKSTYVLGPGDQLLIRIQEMAEEIGDKPYQLDMRGRMNLPLIGRITAAGRTVEQLENDIAAQLGKFVKNPQVSISVFEMRSQPISVLGAVKKPGVHQLQGSKTLLEVLSLAEGLREDAGYSIRITRQRDWGKIPLDEAHEDESGKFFVAEVGVKEILEGRAPQKNIAIMPNDVITVPKGELIYVLGAVKKSGGFVLGEKEKLTVLQAVSMAEGMEAFAQSNSVRILRKSPDPQRRNEILVNLKAVLEGKSIDVALQSEDILYIPTSATKKALARSLEAGINVGTGVAIWRR